MFQIINPATGDLLTEVKEDTPESIRQKIESARWGQRFWEKVSLSSKIEILRKWGQILDEKKEILAKTLTHEMGKPITQSRNEITGVLGRLQFFLDEVEQTLAPQTVLAHPEGTWEERISYDPLGVIANISAWNYPYFVSSNVFLPALLAGNAVVFKPSEFATLTGMAIAESLYDAGIPEEVFPVVLGKGEAAEELLHHSLNGVFFTGSYATGRKIAAQTASRFIKTQFELGGKDAAYVTEEAHLENAALALADGAFYNTGQSCCSVERIYVHQKAYPEFIDRFLEAVKKFRVGDPLDDSTYIGPVTRKNQLDYLEAQVNDACLKGAQILTGGKRMEGPGFYFQPTVAIQVHHEMLLMKEETFGPLIGIQSVSGDAEALEKINDSRYGLTGSIYSQDRTRAQEFLSQVQTGSVYWNCCDRISPRLPWTGRKDSGIGSTLSSLGIQAFVQPKAWHLRSK